MTTRNSFNTDKSYELMAHIINDHMSPFDEQSREALTEILRLCYVYSANDGKGYECTAADLGQSIVDYLSEGYGVPNFHASSEEFWNPAKTESVTESLSETKAERQVDDTPTLDGMLIP